jgi:hypothetical protein
MYITVSYVNLITNGIGKQLSLHWSVSVASKGETAAYPPLVWKSFTVGSINQIFKEDFRTMG